MVTVLIANQVSVCSCRFKSCQLRFFMCREETKRKCMVRQSGGIADRMMYLSLKGLVATSRVELIALPLHHFFQDRSEAI